MLKRFFLITRSYWKIFSLNLKKCKMINVTVSVLVSLLRKKSFSLFSSLHCGCGQSLYTRTLSVKYHQLCTPFLLKASFMTFHAPPFRTLTLNHACYQNSETQNSSSTVNKSNTITIANKQYEKDEWTNATPNILNYLGRNLHLKKDHPIALIKQVIVNHFYQNYRWGRGPIFAVFDDLSPVVTVAQNFDELLIPQDHVSRRKTDNYYLNKEYLLRAHTSAHEQTLIKSGLDAFLTVGDVYRRDSIDSTHFPVFHQLEGVRLYTKSQLFANSNDSSDYKLFETSEEQYDKQACHTYEASKLLECDLKNVLIKCVKELFGQDVECKWVDAYFPFTHPSFELEIKYKNEWIEMLGCGVLRQEILNSAGAGDKVAWAFGLGLERLAMRLFDIPDIRYFWSTEEAVLSQFRGHNDIKNIKFKPIISNQPVISNDISFWIPNGFSQNDFYDLVRGLDNNLVEYVTLIDEFKNSKSGRTSHCYRLFYRHTSRALVQNEVTEVHDLIKNEAVRLLGVEGRW